MIVHLKHPPTTAFMVRLAISPPIHVCELCGMSESVRHNEATVRKRADHRMIIDEGHPKSPIAIPQGRRAGVLQADTSSTRRELQRADCDKNTTPCGPAACRSDRCRPSMLFVTGPLTRSDQRRRPCADCQWGRRGRVSQTVRRQRARRRRPVSGGGPSAEPALLISGAGPVDQSRHPAVLRESRAVTGPLPSTPTATDTDTDTDR